MHGLTQVAISFEVWKEIIFEFDTVDTYNGIGAQISPMPPSGPSESWTFPIDTSVL